MTCSLDWVNPLSPSAYHVLVFRGAAQELDLIFFPPRWTNFTSSWEDMTLSSMPKESSQIKKARCQPWESKTRYAAFTAAVHESLRLWRWPLGFLQDSAAYPALLCRCEEGSYDLLHMFCWSWWFFGVCSSLIGWNGPVETQSALLLSDDEFNLVFYSNFFPLRIKNKSVFYNYSLSFKNFFLSYAFLYILLKTWINLWKNLDNILKCDL